jgi:hypothetical protein
MQIGCRPLVFDDFARKFCDPLTRKDIVAASERARIIDFRVAARQARVHKEGVCRARLTYSA